MISALQTILPIIIYILLIILIIIGIILGIRSIQTLNKLDKVVDDVNDKVQSLNGIFSVIDFTTDKVVSITDKVIEGITHVAGKLFSHKKRKNDIEEEEI